MVDDFSYYYNIWGHFFSILMIVSLFKSRLDKLLSVGWSIFEIIKKLFLFPKFSCFLRVFSLIFHLEGIWYLVWCWKLFWGIWKCIHAKFFKNGCNGKDGQFLLEMQGTSLYCLPSTPPFSNFVHPHPSHFTVTSNSHPHCSLCCHVSLVEWVIMPYLMCYFT